MGRRNRETLKNFFKKGSLPSEENFHDLIDSSLNMNDEGFNKTPENGLEILSQARRPTLLSFFRDEDPADPIWRIAFDEVDRRRLLVWDQGPPEGEPDEAVEPQVPEPTLALGPGARVGVNTRTPERELDVNGYVRSVGREGVVPDRAALEDAAVGAVEQAPALADGRWHTITAPLDGCHALEVVAGVGVKRTGRYALLHAVAVNPYHPTGFLVDLFGWKKRIRITQGYHRSRSDRLALRWSTDPKGYVLQIRTRRDYGTYSGKQVRIRYHLTELWSDHDMSGSWDPPAT